MLAKDQARFDYFRLNVEEGLDLMKLDEWRARGPVRTKIGERIGTFRSSLRKNQRKNNKTAGDGATNGQPNNGLKENHGNLHNGTGTNHMNGNGNGGTGRAGQQDSSEPEAATNGHLPTTGISAQRLDLNADDTKVPQWFQSKNLTLEWIHEHTERYLSRPETIKSIDRCAEKLVDGRRRRAKNDPSQWEKACFGTWYQCNVSECPRGEKEYEQREQHLGHLQDKHKSQFPSIDGRHKLEEALDSYKIIVH